MSKKISKEELCYNCRQIHPIMSNGNPYESSLGEYLDSVGYQNPSARVFMNQQILHFLKNNGGCSSCIGLLERATKS